MSPATRPPRSLLLRFTASRASTLTALLIALALHVALLSFAYVYHITTKPTEIPELLLPQGYAIESTDAAPSHPTVTFTDAPVTPFSREPQASATFADPVPKDLLKPSPVADPTPPQPQPTLPLDLALGTRDAADFPSPSASAVPPRPTPHANPEAAGHHPAADARPTESTSRPPQYASNTAPSASATPQGTPDVPPTPSSRNKVPPYPPDALRRRLAGTVLLELHIAASGRVTDAVIQQSSGHDVLDASARDTALTWIFTPARLEGRPVPVTVLRPVNFIPPR